MSEPRTPGIRLEGLTAHENAVLNRALLIADAGGELTVEEFEIIGRFRTARLRALPMARSRLPIRWEPPLPAGLEGI